jgi:hypothetical protein
MMDEKMKGQMMEELTKIGISEDMVDDHLIWGATKMMMGMGKVMWSLKESGVDDAKAKEMLKKMTDRMMEMDMSAKMDDWKDHKHGHCNCG